MIIQSDSLISRIFNETSEVEIDNDIIVQKVNILLGKGVYENEMNLSSTYMTKPFVDYNGQSVFPEIYIVKKCIENGMNAFWIDTFHKKSWFDMPNTMKYMNAKENNLLAPLIEKNGGKTSGCWDVFAWNKDSYFFIESKGIPSNDKIRPSQIEWYNLCIRNGINNRSFIVFEWDYI